MATWNSRGLRGSQLENIINQSNEKYHELGLALVQKIPTPIKPVEIDDNRHITLAYFEQKSTVDYIGAVQSFPVCFDAKECASDSFSFANLHEHQFKFMEDFESQSGIAFLLIYFSKHNKYYYMRFEEVKKFYQRAIDGIKKSVNINELDSDYFLLPKYGVPLHYLEGINKDINERD